MAKVKNAITKPRFSRIFAERLVFFLVLFAFITGMLLASYGARIDSERSSEAYRKRIGEYAKHLYKAKTDGVDYEKRLYQLKLAIAIYQMVEDNYAEVHIEGEETITVPDTAALILPGGSNESNIFFIEDTAYIDPINGYMNGKFNMRDYNLWESKNQYEYVYLFYFNNLGGETRQYLLKDAYVNRETHTFIPGKVQVTDSRKTYDIDCTPKDTKGYEYVESGYIPFTLFSCYRIAPEKTSADVDSYIIPDKDGEPWNIDPGFDWNKDEVLKSKPWYVAYKESEKGVSVFRIAPLSSACIIATGLLAAIFMALLFAFVKYQKDKTIWKIFEYRTKTTEAMAHDLKTPMAAIAAYAESMETFAGDADKTAEYSHRISEKIRAMDHMVEDILALSRSESGSIDIAAEEVNVMALVTESLEAFPDLKTNISGGQVKIKTDRKLFKQAVDNLLSNSDRYGDKDSTVDIVIDDGGLTVTNKTSASYDDVESLKKPFVKGSDSRSDRGTGLGLSIADNNLNILGYKLVLKSGDGVFEARVKFKN